MPEIHNPNLQDKNSSRFSALFLTTAALGLLAISLLISHHFGNRVASPTTHMQTQPPTTSATSATQHPPSPFGWLTIVAEPLYLALQLLYAHCLHNWGWAIILLTAIFNALLIWPRIVSLKSSLKMARIRPQVDAIKKRTANVDGLNFNHPKRIAMNSEIAELYRSEGASMYSGCLPMLLQMPLLFAYQRVLHNATELHGAHWLWITDLSVPDPLHLLPILIIGSMCLTQFLTPSVGMDPTQRRVLAIALPLAMGFTLGHYASGLALYWLTGNLCSLLLQFCINRTRFGKELNAIASSHTAR